MTFKLLGFLLALALGPAAMATACVDAHLGKNKFFFEDYVAKQDFLSEVRSQPPREYPNEIVGPLWAQIAIRRNKVREMMSKIDDPKTAWQLVHLIRSTLRDASEIAADSTTAPADRVRLIEEPFSAAEMTYQALRSQGIVDIDLIRQLREPMVRVKVMYVELRTLIKLSDLRESGKLTRDNLLTTIDSLIDFQRSVGVQDRVPHLQKAREAASKIRL